jgi:hypothetical protein
MAVACQIAGCKSPVPSELEQELICVGHFTLGIEQHCAELRRETISAATDAVRCEEIIHYVSVTGEKLARVATHTPRLPDEVKARILSTFLTLMNLRESIERAAQRAGNRG